MWLSYLALNITLYASLNGANSVFKNMKVFMQQYKLNTRNLTNHTAQLCLALVIVTLLYQVMRSSLHPTHSHGHWNGSHMRCIYSVTTFMSCITVAKRPCYGRLKLIRAIILFVTMHYFSSCIMEPANSNACCFGYHCRRRSSDCCQEGSQGTQKGILDFK
jgi:hypothetical protein